MGIAVSVENGLQRRAGYWTIIPPTLQCLLRRKGQCTSTTPAVQPQNQPGRRCETVPWTDLLALAPRIDSAQGIPRRKCLEWLHPPQQVTMGFPSIIHQEKGWQPPPMR